MSPNCIVFDLDETLISTTKRQFQVINDFFVLNSMSIEFNYGIYLKLRKNFKLTNSEVYLNLVSDNNLFEDFRKYYLENIENMSYLGLDSLILSEENVISLGKLSEKFDFKLLSLRNNKINSSIQLEKLGINICFSEIFFLPYDRNINPKTLDLINIKSRYEHSIFVGDALSDYEAALKADVEFIKVQTGVWDFVYDGLVCNDINEFIESIKNYE